MGDVPYKSPYGYRDGELERWKGAGLREAERDTPEPGKDMRRPFARDHDRLLYTSAFRRLQGKTQVVTPGEADFFHTRLTHTIEVAQMARRLAEYLNFKARWQLDHGKDKPQNPAPPSGFGGPAGFVDPDVCEAAAVLHDLGHPPFGHAGEVALSAAVDKAARRWKLDEDSGGFEGNAQSLRMATTSLRHKPDAPGLQLTRAVLDAAIKYPWPRGAKGVPKSDRKWSVFPTERAAFEFVRRDRPDVEALHLAKTVEAQIVEWADDIAYSVHDLDDWYRAGFMPLAELASEGSQELKRLIGVLQERMGSDGKAGEDLRIAIRGLFTESDAFARFRAPTGGQSISDPDSQAAREAIRNVRSFLFDEFTTQCELRVRPGATSDWPQRYALTLHVDDQAKTRAAILQELLWIYVVESTVMATHQAGQQRLVSQLFRVYAKAASDLEREKIAIFPPDVRADLLALKDNELERLRRVVDFVAGMTDAYALRAHARVVSGTAPFREYL